MVMRRRGAKHRAVCQHGGCNELRVKGPIVHAMEGGSRNVWGHVERATVRVQMCAEGRAVQCE